MRRWGERAESASRFGQVEGSNPLPSTIYFVYILQSQSAGRYYIGSTDHLLRRFQQHRAGYSAATRGRGPWWMPYYEILPFLAAARHREAEL
ncbi:MAG: GIY-YIG nuclease family protein [Verrucomicrobia bacterium]|nr:GIY-YIG nuclease family protein [Verrucomicrobiota bacterium]